MRDHPLDLVSREETQSNRREVINEEGGDGNDVVVQRGNEGK